LAGTQNGPWPGLPEPSPATVNGYRVLSRPITVHVLGTNLALGTLIVQYGRAISDTEETVARVELFLLLGVLAGTGLALLAGGMIARRAMAPIAERTSTPAELAHTPDPPPPLPHPHTPPQFAD